MEILSDWQLVVEKSLVERNLLVDLSGVCVGLVQKGALHTALQHCSQHTLPLLCSNDNWLTDARVAVL
jgi:hypothetical protein